MRQRIIKFRAWDKEKKKWVDLEHLFLNPCTGNVMIDTDNSCLDPDCCGGPYPNYQDTDRYETTQFTGLLDKNGKEIYEGDIVRYKDVRPLAVEWDEKFAQFVTRPSRTIQYFIAGDVEIIGNVYEHPELIEGKGGA